MAHITRIGAESVVVAWLAVACAGPDAARRATAETGEVDSATLATTTTAAETHVSNVMIGRRIGTGNLITEPTFEFTPGDTVHISVATAGGGGADTLTAAWRYQTGEILKQSSQLVPPAGENAAFSLAQPKGLKPGTYKTIVFLGDDSVDTKVFVVKK
jgi:hypothetical protein